MMATTLLRTTISRVFITTALLWSLCLCTPVLAEWYRGNTHSHTTESDGDSAPSAVVEWYHDQGYNFLLLTDHNVFVDPATVPMPADLRDDFILIAGEEISGNFTIHTTAMNIDSLADWSASGTKTEVVQGHVHEALAHGGEAILNHPNFTYALSAADILPVTNLYLFELYNGHPSVNNFGDATHDSTEEIWDDLLTSGMRICAVASDDAHHLQAWADNKSNPGRGWVMAKADQLAPDDITAAMTNGDFYASSGVFFDYYEPVHDRYSIRIDAVRTQAELDKAFVTGHERSGVSAGWTLQFIGPNGSVLSETNATSADYITGTHQYVRAKATFAREISPGSYECFYAWGQPVYPGDPVSSDIRILGNGLTISAGDMTPDSILGTDFGVTTQAVTHTFTITNQSGSTTLDLTNTPRVTVAAGPGNFFTLSQDAASGSLAPGTTTTFEVTYDPSSGGVHTALVSIASTDSTQPLYSFALVGMRLGPPAVNNAGGATSSSPTTATLHGELTAGVAAHAWVCWGPADAGGNTSGTGTWQNVIAISPAVSMGMVFSNTISGLYYGIPYSYAVYVSNAVDDAWSSVTNFTTEAPPLSVPDPAPYQSTVLADGPIIYYTFDEISGTTASNSGSLGASHDGTINTVAGSVTINQASFPNGKTSYDFGGGHVGAAALPTSLTEWTLEVWINWDSAKNSESHIFGNDQGGWNDDVLFGIGAETGSVGVPADNVGCIQQGAPGTTRDVVTEPLSHSEWHHVVATGSTTNGELKLYVDGVLEDTDNSPANGMTLNGADGIGSALLAVGAARTVNDAGSRPFDGLIDEFAIYDSVLSSNIIASHYEGGTATSSAKVLLVDIDINGTTSGTVLNQSGTEVIAVDASNRGDKRMTVNGTHLTQAAGVAIAVPTTLTNAAGLPRQVINVTGELTNPGTPGFPGIWFSTTDHTGGGSEADYDFAVAYFPFDGGWIAGTVDQDGNVLAGNTTGVTITKRSGTGVNAGNYALDIAGVNPSSDGYLFTIGAQNENSGNFAPARIQPDYSGWDITISDQGGDAADGTNGENDDWSFVYLPETVPNLVAGRIDDDATVLDSGGSFSVTARPTTGEYLLKIPDGSGGFLGKDDGILLLNVTKDVAPTFDGADDNFLLQEYSSTDVGFIVTSHDLAAANDQTTEWSFAFLRFDAPPFITFASAITNTVATNVTASTADLVGTLDAYHSVFTVYAYYGTNNNIGASAWLSDSTATNSWVGTYTNVTGQSVTGSASGLKAGTTYYYTMMATNAATNIWASPSRSFTTPASSGVTTNHSVPYSWLLGIDSSWSNDFEAAATGDPDGDGFETGQEYWSGTDPMDSNSVFKIDSLEYDETNIVLQWRHAAIDEPIPAIHVRSSADHVTGLWLTVGQTVPSNGTNRWTNSSSPNAFYRLEAIENP